MISQIPSRRQAELLEYLATFRLAQGRPPTVREMGEALGIRSPNGVVMHLKALERKGWIQRERKQARGIKLLCQPRVERRADGRIDVAGIWALTEAEALALAQELLAAVSKSVNLLAQ